MRLWHIAYSYCNDINKMNAQHAKVSDSYWQLQRRVRSCAYPNIIYIEDKRNDNVTIITIHPREWHTMLKECVQSAPVISGYRLRVPLAPVLAVLAIPVMRRVVDLPITLWSLAAVLYHRPSVVRV